ncbi:MAG: hypothetical protein JXA67_00725, partial [Micromonosporaceae bacterium]|nr:hypothetical protein [Micromonosporaceae bacterium]
MDDRYRASQRALLLRHEERYGLRRMLATVVYPVGGELHSPCFSPIDRATELADLEISAHLSADMTGAYGFHVAFAPRSVELARAQSMVRVLRRVERRMREAQTRFGYPGNDFHQYLMHAALALDISRYVLGQPVGQRTSSGPGHQWATADEVRGWI